MTWATTALRILQSIEKTSDDEKLSPLDLASLIGTDPSEANM